MHVISTISHAIVRNRRRTYDVECSRLASSVRSKESEDRVLRHPKADIVDDEVRHAPERLHDVHHSERVIRLRDLRRLVIDILDVRLLVLRSCGSPRARNRLLAELRELADDDGARVDPDEDAEEDERVDEQIQDRAAVARDVAEGRRGYGTIAIAEQ